LAVLRSVLGLDPGGHSIKVVELQQSFRGLTGSKVHWVPRGSDDLADVVRDLLEIHSLDKENVVTALRGDRASIRTTSFPFTERRRLAQAVPLEIEDQLPFDVEEIVFDWHLASTQRGRAEVISAVAQRHEVSSLIESLREAGCDPRIVECEGLVLANLTGAFELPGSRVLVDIGHRKTALCVLVAGRPVAARSIAVAGAALTQALAEDRGLGLEDAERVKCDEGVLDPTLGGPLPKVAGVLDQIAQEIVRLVASLDATLHGTVSEVTLMGGSAQLDRIDEILAERTGLPTARIGLPREDTGMSLVAGGSPVVFAPTIALALRGTSRAVTELNLRQDEFAHRVDFGRYLRDFRSTGVLALVLAALIVASFAIQTVLETRRASQVEARIEALYAGALPDRSLPANPVAAMREAVRDATERADFLGVYRGNLSALDLLTEISKQIPQDLLIVFEEVSIDRQTIRIRASSESFEAAERVGAALQQFAPFGEARIGAIETDKRTGSKRFNVTISLAGSGEAA
jgi:general secretion pathway protein L